MTGRMIEFDTAGAPASGYLATPDTGSGPGVVVLHTWWGLTHPFRQACDRLAEAGFVALAPDLYHGKTAANVEEAAALGDALDQKVDQWRGDIRGALQYVRENGATSRADGHSACSVVAFSLGGSYALDLSIQMPDEIATVVIFYATYPGLDYSTAKATYLCHFAGDDPWTPSEAVADLEQSLKAAGRPVTVYIYPGVKHSFFESDRPEAYDPAAATLAWERTVTFLTAETSR